jgi:hypothetical protein
MVRRPVGRFASAEVGTVASTNSRERSAPFGRGKARAPGGMLRVSVASDQKPWTQGLEKSSVGGGQQNYGVFWRKLWLFSFVL